MVKWYVNSNQRCFIVSREKKGGRNHSWETRKVTFSSWFLIELQLPGWNSFCPRKTKLTNLSVFMAQLCWSLHIVTKKMSLGQERANISSYNSQPISSSFSKTTLQQ